MSKPKSKDTKNYSRGAEENSKWTPWGNPNAPKVQGVHSVVFDEASRAYVSSSLTLTI